MGQIVQIGITQTAAPTPNTYQSMGALVSQGATTLAPGTYALLTGLGSLAPLLAPALGLASLSWSGGQVQATANAAIAGLQIGDAFITTIAGAVPAAYNGTYLATVTSATTCTFALAANPGANTSPGTYTPSNQGELQAMNNTYWAQGVTQAVYVLELGAGDASTGPAALQTFENNNPNFFYAYLTPRSWDSTAGLLALIAEYEAATAQKYFWVTTTPNTYQNYTAAMKCVYARVEAPNLPITEFSLAADFQNALSFAPSSTNKAAPFCYRFLEGVTPFPTFGNSALLAALKAASINVVGTGSEGGIPTAITLYGQTLDGNDLLYWQSVDWIQINEDLNIANATINGSQPGANPLIYDQDGINRLQDVAIDTMGQAVTNGLALGSVARATLDPITFAANVNNGVYAGQCVINAVPFLTYLAANPNDYKARIYRGLQGVYIPATGFKQIFFTINVTQLVTQ